MPRMLQLGADGQTLIDPRLAALEARARRDPAPMSAFSSLARLGLAGAARYKSSRAEKEALADRKAFSTRLAALSSPDPVTGALPDAGAARMAALDLAAEGIGSSDPLVRQSAMGILSRNFDELLTPPDVTTEKFGKDSTGLRKITKDRRGGVSIETLQEPAIEAPDEVEVLPGSAIGLTGPDAKRYYEVTRRPDGGLKNASPLSASPAANVTIKNLTGVAGEIDSVRSAVERGVLSPEEGEAIIRQRIAEESTPDADPAKAEGEKVTARQNALSKRQAAVALESLEAIEDFMQTAGPAAAWSPAKRRIYATLSGAAANELAKARGTPGAEPGIPILEEARAALPTLDDLPLGSAGGAFAGASGDDIVGGKLAAIRTELERKAGKAPQNTTKNRKPVDEMDAAEVEAEIKRLEMNARGTRGRGRGR